MSEMGEMGEIPELRQIGGQRQVCHICGRPCEDGWGWVLFEFWDIPEAIFAKMEAAAGELEKRPLCREHLVGAFQVMRDYLRSGGDADLFGAKMEARREAG